METPILGILVLAGIVCTCMAQVIPFNYELKMMGPGSGMHRMALLKAVRETRPFPELQPMPTKRRPIIQEPSMPMMNTMFMPPSPAAPDCPLEVHPDTETMFIMRGPLGDPEPRMCPPGTYFLRSVCSCVNIPVDKCNLRPSVYPGWYEENVFGMWIQRPCGPGSAFNPKTCDCSLTL